MALEAVGSNPIIHPILKSNLRVAFFAKKEQKMLKKVMIKITSKCEELADSLFERYFGGDNFEEGDFEADDYALEEALNAVADVEFDFSNEEKEAEDDGVIEIYTEGRLRTTAEQVSLTYEETEITGMEGSKTVVSFLKSQPELVTMTRTGAVNTALVFEPKKRHICIYKTPYMPFELCVRTLSMDNRLESDGEFSLEYIIEIRGATAEHNKLQI